MNTKAGCIALLLVVGLLLSVPAVGLAQDEINCEELAPPGAPPMYYLGLGDAYFASAEYTDAIIAYTCALTVDPEYVPAYVNRGYAQAAQRNDPQALVDYNRALEIDQTSVAAYNNRGLLYTGQGNFGLAINDFTLALTLDPEYAIAYNNRGIVHAAEGNYDLAMADFEQALALDPEFAAPHASLGALYSALAVQQYQQYQTMVGPHGVVPGGGAVVIMDGLDNGLESGSISVWLSFLTPAQ